MTPTLQFAVLQTTRRDANNHWPSSLVPELNWTRLSSPSDKGFVLGEGTYGLTRLMHFNGNLPVAVKEFKGNDMYKVKKEAGIISELQRRYHPNLQYVLGICVKEKPYLMITQFYGKSTKSYSLRKAIARKILGFEKLGKVFKQIVDALIYIHEASWLHNDIKENNVLMHSVTEQEWKPVVIDFEKSRSQTKPKRYQLTEAQKVFYKSKHPCIAPELIEGTHTQSIQTDVFSVGKLLESTLGRFVRQDVSYENLASSCTTPQKLRISLKELKDGL